MSSVRARLGRVGILQPLSIRDFAWLWIGMTVSMVGDGIYIVAIAWQVYQLSNTPTALAAVGIAWSLPQIILLLGSGVLSDRVDRRHLMIAGDILRLVAIGTVGVLSIAGELTIPLLIGLVVVYGVGQAAVRAGVLVDRAEHRARPSCSSRRTRSGSSSGRSP